MEKKHEVSRQVTRAKMREQNDLRRRNERREARHARKTAVVKAQRDRDAGDVDRKAMRIPLVNLIGSSKICQGWFRRGDFR